MVRAGHTLADKVKAKIVAFWRDEEAASAAEYGIVLALIAIAAVAAFQAFGEELVRVVDKGTEKLK